MKSIEIFFHDLNADAQKRYIEVFGDDDNRDLNPIAILECEDECVQMPPPEPFFEGTVEVLQHTVNFNYEITHSMLKGEKDLHECLKNEAEERAKAVNVKKINFLNKKHIPL